MPVSSFEFLLGVHQRLHTYAISAERLCWTDPEACHGRLRKLAEWIAIELARRCGVNQTGDLIDVTRRLEQVREIGASIRDPLNHLRVIGNRALHFHTPGPPDAVDDLRVAWRLCVAFTRHIHAPVQPPGSFIAPPDPRGAEQRQQERVDAAERAARQAEAENSELRAALAERPAPVATDTLARQLRELAAATQTPLKFAGLATRGTRPQINVEDIYVHRSFESADGSILTGEAFLADLERAATVAPRHVVIGAAGAGKTTLCRHIVGALARRGRTVLLLRLRAQARAADQHDLDAILDAAARWICAQLSLVVTAADVARLLEHETSVVLFDGFDELAAEDARRQLTERLHAFALRFPRVAVVVTSREQVLRQTPLDPIFVPLRLFPFTTADAALLATRLFAAADLGSAAAAHTFTEQLGTRPGLRELLSTPLTVTLLAFLRAEAPALPTTSSGVLEQCVRVWLERWPRATDRPPSIVPGGHERALLEGVAQVLVEHADRGHALGFGALVQEIAAIHLRIVPLTDADAAERVAELWLEHHLAHVGILEEDDYGNVYFAHWSLMQHLAACTSSAALIAARVADLAHQDLCLLACEIHGHDADFLGQVATAAVDAPSVAASHWLLRSAGDGIRFTPAAVIAASRRLVAAHHLEVNEREGRTSFSPTLHVTPAAELIDRYPAHAESIRAWALGELQSAHGDDLVAMVTWAAPILGVEAVLAALSARPDTAAAAVDLLPLWPANVVGTTLPTADDDTRAPISCALLSTWAAQHLDCENALRWALSLTDADLLDVAATALAMAWSPNLDAALTVALTARSLALGLSHPDAIASVAHRLARNQTHVLALPGKVELLLGFRIPARARYDAARTRPTPSADLRGRLCTALQERFPDEPGLCMHPPDATPSDVHLPDLDWSPARPDADLHSFVRACTELCPVPAEMHMLGLIGVPLNIHELWNRRLVLTPVAGASGSPPNTACRVPTHLFLFMNDATPGAAPFHQRVWSAHHGEAALALFATDGVPDGERRAHLDLRIGNRWLLETWTLLERRWSTTGTDTGAALLLALGCSQHVTTGTWPGTSTWAELVDPRPNDPWLVRVHAHLCWLAHDRRSATHRAGLRRALSDGDRDPALGAVAAALRRLIQ